MSDQAPDRPDGRPDDASTELPSASGDTGDRPLPSRVTMPLLSLLTQDSMDEGYRVVAERRAVARAEGGDRGAPDEEGAAGGERRSRWVTAAAVAVFGVLVAVAGVQTSLNADVEALGRESLAERIAQEKTSVRELQTRAGELLDENAADESALRELRQREEQLASRVSRLGARTGYLAVQGPGLRVTLDDPPDSDGTTAVQDEDLHLLVDGLWAAGAEAIAINGQRLTVLSPIQNTGRAIHVNVRPVTPPYVVEAIGDPDQLAGRLLASTNGALFYSVARALGFALDVDDDEHLELPAARVRPLRSAKTGTSEDHTNSSKERTSP